MVQNGSCDTIRIWVMRDFPFCSGNYGFDDIIDPPTTGLETGHACASHVCYAGSK